MPCSGHLQIEWRNTFEVSFISDQLDGRRRLATFLESDETIFFLSRAEFGLSPDEVASTVRDASTGSPVIVPHRIWLAEEQLREMFPFDASAKHSRKLRQRAPSAVG